MDYPPPYNPGFVENKTDEYKDSAPPLYENWAPQNGYTRSPYDNPLTVGLISGTSVPVPDNRPHHTVVTILPVVLGHHSARMNCPHCLADISTGIRREPSILAYISCILMFLFGLWCCCCIPFCMDSCKDTEHSCPNCGRTIGRRG